MRGELIIAAGVMLALGGATAAAQSPPVPPERIEPMPDAQQEGGNLSDRLDATDGVLEPPPTGDRGLVEPPPTSGSRTPVIPPSVVPPGGSGDGSPSR